LDLFKLKPEFNPRYLDTWTDLVSFDCCDAAKPLDKYVDDTGKDFTHIYSYNKVMSLNDTAGIAYILNRTNWKIMAWYFDP